MSKSEAIEGKPDTARVELVMENSFIDDGELQSDDRYQLKPFFGPGSYIQY